MKTVFFLSFLAAFHLQVSSQNKEPLVWTSSYEPINNTEGYIILRAQIEPGWHTYSQRPTDAGPISTLIEFTNSNNYKLIGKTEELNVKEEFDKAFEATVFMFSGKAEFKQKIKLSTKGGFSVRVKIEYTCCSDSMCLPPKTNEFNVKVQ